MIMGAQSPDTASNIIYNSSQWYLLALELPSLFTTTSSPRDAKCQYCNALGAVRF